MNAILVPTDFSDTADKALRFAAQIARKEDKPLVLLHVCDMIDYSFRDREVLVKEYNEKKKKELLSKLHDLKHELELLGNIKISIELYDGDFMEAILNAIREYQVSLIVMGMVGINGGLIFRLIGGKTSLLIRKSPIPVLAIPKSQDKVLLKNIVVAVEEDEPLTEQLNIVFELTSLFAGSLKVLHFSPNKEPVYELINDTRHLHHFTTILQKKYSNFKLDEVIIGGKNFTKAIETYAETFPIDLLVMFVHHRECLDQLMGHSVTHKIIRNTQIPTLVIPT